MQSTEARIQLHRDTAKWSVHLTEGDEVTVPDGYPTLGEDGSLRFAKGNDWVAFFARGIWSHATRQEPQSDIKFVTADLAAAGMTEQALADRVWHIARGGRGGAQ